jgi:hypothetical protein
MGSDAILENLQSSLRDSVMSHDVTQELASWAKFSRPYGTRFVSSGSRQPKRLLSGRYLD